MKKSDPDYERLKDDDFSGAKPVPPEKYAQVMNSALREFRKKQAA